MLHERPARPKIVPLTPPHISRNLLATAARGYSVLTGAIASRDEGGGALGKSEPGTLASAVTCCGRQDIYVYIVF